MASRRFFANGKRKTPETKKSCTDYGSLCTNLPSFSLCWDLLTGHSSNNDSYVVKPVTSFIYEQAFRLQKELSFSPFIRLPVDGNNANTALIFPHYTEDFLSFMQSGPVSRSQVKRILFDILRGIAACHSKDWVHCGNDFLAWFARPQIISVIANDGLAMESRR